MAEEKECCCSHKTKERSEKEYKDMIHRLNRIEGQIRGIRGMLEKSAYCPDILAQAAAANAALMTAARNRCVLEVNTSAVYRGFRKDFFPSDAILKEWLVLSGNVVITADAHDTKALTFGFEAVAAKLKELGYTKVQVLGKDGFTPCEL